MGETMGEANASGYSNQDYLIEGTILKKYLGNDSRVELPEGLEVIESDAFRYNDHIESVVIPQTIKKIENEAFSHCSRLKSVVLPEQLEEIGEHAFAWCENLDTITIPANINTLCYGIFRHCSKLKSVELPEKLEKIESFAFEECRALETIVCYQELKYISYKAFEGCSNIDLTLIGALSEKFVKSTSFFFRKIRTINFDENHSEVVFVDGCFLSKDKKKLIAYLGCRNGGHLRIPDGVISIEERLVGLSSVVLPEGLQELEDLLFAGSEMLSYVYISGTIKYIGINPFFGCPNLKCIEISSNNKFYTVKEGALYTMDMLTLVSCPYGDSVDFKIPEETKTIGSCAFAFNNHIRKINFSNVEKIMLRACAVNTKLHTIQIGNKTRIIETEAFGWCSEVKELSINGMVSYLEPDNCVKLREGIGVIELSKEEIEIAEDTFYKSTIGFSEDDKSYAITIKDPLVLPNVGWWLNSDGSMEEQENCTWG